MTAKYEDELLNSIGKALRFNPDRNRAAEQAAYLNRWIEGYR